MIKVGNEGKVFLDGIKPMVFVDTNKKSESVNNNELSTLNNVAKTVLEYLKAGKEMLENKYHNLREFAPPHLLNPGNALIIQCRDGIVIRYENSENSCRILGTLMDNDLPNTASFLSQNVVHCKYDDKKALNYEKVGIPMKISIYNPTTGKSKEMLSAKILFEITISLPQKRPAHTQKPFCLLSVQNRFELCIAGELDGVDESKKSQEFITRTNMKMPVGWECIEVYPSINSKDWNPDYANIWAENDILASVASRQFNEMHFQSIDPKAEARQQYGIVLNEFKALLDSNPEREQDLQAFLQNHPVLLCPTHTRMWPKLAFGSRVTDFVFRDATQDYLLVELERSTLPLFKKNGHTTAELNHAKGQIGEWKRYLEDNLGTVQRELGLDGISVNPNSVVVIGRSKELTVENKRALVSMANEHPKLKIMTYDDVYENAKAVIENLFGSIWETPGHTKVYYPNF